MKYWQAVKYFWLGFWDYIVDNGLTTSTTCTKAYKRGRELALTLTGGF